MSATTAKYACAYCEHQFRHPQKWLDHEAICKLLANPHQHHQQEDDPIVTIIDNNTATTYTILKHLARRQQQLEKELQELKKQSAVKIDTLEWLQQSVAPTPRNSLKHFIDTIATIQPSHIDDLLTSNAVPIDWIAECITSALTEYKKTIPTYTQRPIFIVVTNPTATNPTAKIFYYSSPTDIDPIPLWKETTQLHETIWDRICKNIVRSMGEWRDTNKNRSATDEKIYQNTLLKIIDPKKESAYHKKIKGILIEQLKYPTVTYHLV